MMALFLSATGLAVAILILWLVRRDRLHVSHGLGWIGVAVGFALLGFVPSLIDQLASRLHVAYPPALGLVLAIVILVLKILLMDIERSRARMELQRLVQRLAILEARLDQQSARDPESHP